MMKDCMENPAPEVPEIMLAAWHQVTLAIKQFHEITHQEQLFCAHTHAVQYDPQVSSFYNEKGHAKPGPSRRCCVRCGLIEIGDEPYNPDAFSEGSAMYGAEIIQRFDVGCEFNHFIAPAIKAQVAGANRYDALWSQPETTPTE